MNILFVVAHPDDEALGGGAFIFKRSCQGDEVSVLTLSAHSPTRPDSLKKEQAESHAIMGVARTYNANYETMKFGTYDRYEMVRGIEDVIKETEPDIIVTHNPYDVHNDHKITSALVREAARLPQRGTGYSKPLTALLYMEVLSSTEWSYENGFAPNAFFPVSEEALKKKAQAIDCYQQVIRPSPHPRNGETIKSLARYRGCQCGAEYAEAFMCAYLNVGAAAR